jgi:hypothetical protein
VLLLSSLPFRLRLFALLFVPSFLSFFLVLLLLLVVLSLLVVMVLMVVMMVSALLPSAPMLRV